jgi:nuclear migration protein JNM1
LGDGVDGEGETLQMRIARLRREVEECRVLAEKNTESEGGQAESPEGLEADAKALNQLLAQIDVPSVRGGGLLHRRTQQPAGLDATAGKSWTDEAKADLPTAARSTGVEETLTEEQSLSRIAAFDARLASLEAALGLSALDSSGAVASYSSGAGPVPILPALSLLDAQFATLSSAGSLASLEAASAKIAALKHEARTLAALQQSQTVPIGGGAARAGLTTTTHGGDDSAAASEYGDAEEAPSQHDPDGTDIDQNGHSDAQQHLHATDLTTLRALYTHLPTLQALTPTLPALLTRLRSLRALHTTAGAAAADLEALERRQETLDAELATWRAGLERVEAAVREADQANGRNGTVVKGWVEGLEKRVEGLMMGSGGAKTG